MVCGLIPTSAAISVTGTLTSYDVTSDDLDSRVTADSVTVYVDINARNDAPVFQDGSNNTITAGWSGTLLESPVEGVGTPQQKLVPDNTTVYDLDLGTTETLTDTVFGAGNIIVTFSGSFINGDVFSLVANDLDGIATVTGGDGNALSITLKESTNITQVNTILQAIRYENTSDNPQTGARDYTITLSDGDNSDGTHTASGLAVDVDEQTDALTATLTGSINITLVNDPPSLLATGENPTFTEADDATPVILFSDATTDTIQPDQYLTELIMTVSNLSDEESEKLTIDETEISLTAGTTSTAAGSATVSIDAGTGTATVIYTPSSNLTEALTNTLVNSLAYRNTSQDPTDGNRVVTITSLTDNGGVDAYNDDTAELNVFSTVTVVSVNDAPDISSATVSGIFTEGNANPLQFLTGVALPTDVDTDHFNGGSLTVALGGSFHAGDTLQVVDGANNITVVNGTNISYSSNAIGTASYNTDTGTLTISFTSDDATPAAVQALAQQIGYSSTSENPTWAGTANNRSVTVTLNDGGNSGTNEGAKDDLTPVTGTFSIVGINDAPTLTGLDATAATTYIQNGTPVVIDANALLSDRDLEALAGGTGNWNGSTLTISRNVASTDDLFGASASSELTLSSGNIIVSNITIGSYTNASGTLLFTFDADATTALVNTALNSITYSNAVTTAGDLGYDHVDLLVTFNDQNTNITGGGTAGDGQDQGGGGESIATGPITVNIDRLPVATADTNNVDEGVATTDTTTTSGNVLTDGTADSDQDIDSGSGRSDALIVVNAKDSSEGDFTAVASNTTSADGSTVDGDFGSLKIGADGSYVYTVDNTNGSVQALAVGEALTDTLTYQVSDSVGGFNTADLTITIDGTNDGPVITDGPDEVDLAETDAKLTNSGTLTVSDVDVTDVVTASRTLAVTGTSNRSDAAASSDAELLNMFTVTPATILNGSTPSAALSWNFDSDTDTFNYLTENETLILTYTVQARDDDSTFASDTETVTITITGTNDTPTITYGADTASLTETDTTLTTTGTMTVADLDTTDTIDLTVESVAKSGSFTSSGSTLPLDDTALLAMLDLDPESDLPANSTAGTDFDWTFTSGTTGDGAFDFLREDETLILTYTVEATDNSGALSGEATSTTSTVTVTITGTNDTPVITDGADTTSLTETNAQLTTNGSMTITDIDLTDTVTVAVTDVTIDGSGSFGGTVPSTLTANTNAELQSMLSVPGSSLTANPSAGTDFTWAFTSNTSGDGAFEFLAKDETLVLVYTITATDNSGASSGESTSTTSTVTITVTGTNDTPDITVNDVTGAVTEDNGTVADNPNTSSTTETGAYLTATGSVDFDDLDLTDTSTVTSSYISANVTSATGSVDSNLETSLDNLTETFLISGDGVSSETHDGTVDWSFALDNGLTQYLADGEEITVTYRITVNDDSGVSSETLPNEINTSTQDITLTITGTNDDPVISVESGNSTSAGLTETDAGLSDSGTMTVDDTDLTDVVTAAVDSVVVSGTGDSSVPASLTNDTIKDFLTVDPTAILDGSELSNTLTWTFNSNSEAFDFLATGETLVLTYTVSATDDNGTPASDTETVTVTITGTNDAPTVVADTNTTAENVILTVNSANGILTNDTDLDSNDTHTVSAVNGDPGNVGISVTGSNGGTFTIASNGSYIFDPGADFGYLKNSESQATSVTYTNRDNNGGESSSSLTITVSGEDDAAILSTDISDLIETDAIMTTSGTLTISDVDSPETFAAQTDTVGTYGTFSIDEDGAWDYTTSSPHDEFAEGVTYTDIFTVESADGTTTTVTINILGTNDLPILSEDVSDLIETDEILTTGGTLTASDVDNPETFQAQGGTVGIYGTFSISAGGVWSYTTSSPHDEFVAGVTYTDTFTVTSDDGTTTSVTINILGTKEAPVIDLSPPTTEPSPDEWWQTHDYLQEYPQDDSTSPAAYPMSGINNPDQVYTDWWDAHKDSLDLFITPSSQIIQVNETGSFSIPSGTFKHTDPNARLKIEATMAGGGPLPSWLIFDPISGRFDGVPPLGSEGIMDIKISAHDQEGNVAFTQFSLYIIESPAARAEAAWNTDSSFYQGETGQTTLSNEPGLSVNGIVTFRNSTEMSLGSYGLYLANSVTSREIIFNEPTTFNLPAGLFRHSDANARVTLEATLADGSPLPKWITFDSSSGRFVVNAPEDAGETIDIRIIASDQRGNEAETHFLLHIREEHKGDTENNAVNMGIHAPAVSGEVMAMMKGRPSLSEQLASYSRRM